MKILFVGTLISKTEMERLNTIGKRKASIAPNNYETMFVNGLVANGADVDVLSIPAVASYPGNPILVFREKTEIMPDSGVTIRWIPFVNFQGIKQASIQSNAFRLIRNWLEENRNITDKCVVSYSIYPSYTKPLVVLCRKYHCHLSTVIADLPEYMYTWGHSNPIARYLGNKMKNQMLALQGQCDSYILFTERMAARMQVEQKPWMVSEGFTDASIYDSVQTEEKDTQKTIVYAGNLSRLYGIRTLLDGFMKTKGKQELHLYGSGEDVPYIEQCMQKDSRIRFYGRVSREEVLKALKKAHLVVVNKPTSDDYSNYSFSSKIPECMASGTPVLTTKVGGMPKDYYPYFYFIEDESALGIAQAIEKTINLPETELAAMGAAAAAFAKKEKNYISGSQKILLFLEKYC